MPTLQLLGFMTDWVILDDGIAHIAAIVSIYGPKRSSPVSTSFTPRCGQAILGQIGASYDSESYPGLLYRATAGVGTATCFSCLSLGSDSEAFSPDKSFPIGSVFHGETKE